MQPNRNFKTRFREHGKDFINAEGHSSFAKHIIEEGHDMRNIEKILLYTRKTEIIKTPLLNIFSDLINI